MPLYYPSCCLLNLLSWPDMVYTMVGQADQEGFKDGPWETALFSSGSMSLICLPDCSLIVGDYNIGALRKISKPGPSPNPSPSPSPSPSPEPSPSPSPDPGKGWVDKPQFLLYQCYNKFLSARDGLRYFLQLVVCNQSFLLWWYRENPSCVAKCAPGMLQKGIMGSTRPFGYLLCSSGDLLELHQAFDALHSGALGV
jgi:hypothetical protein